MQKAEQEDYQPAGQRSYPPENPPKQESRDVVSQDMTISHVSLIQLVLNAADLEGQHEGILPKAYVSDNIKTSQNARQVYDTTHIPYNLDTTAGVSACSVPIV